MADSQPGQEVRNAASIENLESNAHRVGLDFAALPPVIRFNKRDLPEVLEEGELRRRWRPSGLPLVFASTISGCGVVETFGCIVQAAVLRRDAACGLRQRCGPEAGHLAALTAGACEGRVELGTQGAGHGTKRAEDGGRGSGTGVRDTASAERRRRGRLPSARVRR